MQNRLSTRPAKDGFTLIELLVVISIIALLIGILLPALSKARDVAQQAADLANSRSNGQAIMSYTTDRKTYYPPAYQYRSTNNFNDDLVGTASSTGYLQWSGILIQGGYFQAGKGSVSPQHDFGGWAPTNFDDGTAITTSSAVTLGKDEGAIYNGQVKGTAGVIDTQSPRLSYVPNTAIMGRVKTLAVQQGGLRLVKVDMVEKQSGTVLLGTYTKYRPALAKLSGSAIGVQLKTHRPFGAVKVGASNAATSDYNSEAANGTDPSGTTGSLVTDLRAIPYDEAKAAIQVSIDNGDCINSNMVNFLSLDNYGAAGSAYTFCDGHAAMMPDNASLFDTSDWKWGLRMYSQKNQARITIDGTIPVN